ncbi:MAG: YbjN domain-containing protein [Bacteroidales bacterium]|nr:YbjN domain-containing protein [Bacteroidales bacterium]
MRQKNTAKEMVLAYLKGQGIDASRSKVGINFLWEGWNFLLWHDAEDPLFFRLTLPGIFDVTEENYAQALMACNLLNWNYKVVKASLYEFEDKGRRGASVWVCFEQMLDEGAEASDKVVARAIAALVEAAERFQTLVE